MRVRDRLGVSPRRQRQLSRAMQLALVGIVFIGLDRRSLGIVVNAGVALAVTYVPAILERDYEVPMDAGLTLWITAAVFLHAFGVVGIPGTEGSFYRDLWWWDHLTHALSSSVVAGVGYTVVRGIDEHTESISLPPRFTFVFVVVFVAAFGVFWEVIEFALGGLSSLTGSGQVLTQYGLGDTMLDLLFDLVGGVAVGLYGTAHLTDLSGEVAARLDRYRSGS
ncbi:hypothetical protein RYH80_05565 [Halobaculum sp. MBLA0147]|uniref:hypothetical protein n=1 Tax=Halobaculum sp. MBLA0147 TaxID=3079934 RepID=UPI003525ADBC